MIVSIIVIGIVGLQFSHGIVEQLTIGRIDGLTLGIKFIVGAVDFLMRA